MRIYLYFEVMPLPLSRNLLSRVSFMRAPQKQHSSYISKRLSQHETFLNIPYYCTLIHRNRNSRVRKQDSHFSALTQPNKWNQLWRLAESWFPFFNEAAGNQNFQNPARAKPVFLKRSDHASGGWAQAADAWDTLTRPLFFLVFFRFNWNLKKGEWALPPFFRGKIFTWGVHFAARWRELMAAESNHPRSL